MTVDIYFFQAMGYILLGIAAIIGVIYLGFRIKRLGRAMFWAFIVIGSLFNLLAYSDMIAKSLRPNTSLSNVDSKEG